MTNFPAKIKFKSDGTTVELVGVVPQKDKSKVVMAEYKYTKVDKRSTGKGKTFTIALADIEKLVGYKLIEAK